MFIVQSFRMGFQRLPGVGNAGPRSTGSVLAESRDELLAARLDTELDAASGVGADAAEFDQFIGFTIHDRFLSKCRGIAALRSEEHTSELQSLMRISYAVFCLKKKKQN